ncbi:hypothetical protein BH09PSE6_BH09PSE6_13960 [soil metagenome]
MRRSGSYNRRMVTFHTLLSVVAIIAGLFAIVVALFRPQPSWWTTLFLITAILTSATGYLLPADKILPSHIVGAVALVMLAINLVARWRHLAGAWRWIDSLCLVIGLWLLMFVLVAQGFLHVPPLHALAPTGAEPPFGIAQAVVFAVFVWIGYKAVRQAVGSARVVYSR